MNLKWTGGGLARPQRAAPKPLAKPLAVFAAADADSGDEAGPGGEAELSRRAVNRELVATQQRAEQLAQRAEQKLKEDPDLYDYDSFFEQKQERQRDVLAKREKLKEAKYMAKMMQSSMERKVENDIWRAAKMKKEAEQIQAENEGQVPEEKFVTKAWKEKLEEIWQHKQKQAEQDKADEAAKSKTSNFGKSLISFRQKMLALSEEEQAEASHDKAELEDEYYKALNQGITAAVKKEHREEDRVEKELRQQAEGIEKELQQATQHAPKTTVPPDGTAVAPADPATALKLGPSQAMLRRRQRQQEPPEARLERRRKRWATALTADDIAAARERFLARQAERSATLGTSA